VEAQLRARSDGLQRPLAAAARRTHGLLRDRPAPPRPEPGGRVDSAPSGSDAHASARAGWLRGLERPVVETCAACAAVISGERLRAVPEAVRCLPCQRAFEAGATTD
jgi:hypothetical protein